MTISVRKHCGVVCISPAQFIQRTSRCFRTVPTNFHCISNWFPIRNCASASITRSAAKKNLRLLVHWLILKLRKQQANFIHSTMFMVAGSKFEHELAFKSLSALSMAKNRQQANCLELNTLLFYNPWTNENSD